MDNVENVTHLDILIAPNGSEIVFPIPSPDGKVMRAFIGIQTARTYGMAKLRCDQAAEDMAMRVMKLSNWADIVQWFGLTTEQCDRLSLRGNEWMVTAAMALRAEGFANDDTVSLADINQILENGDS